MELNSLQTVHHIIADAPRRIEAEYAKGQNPWLACVNTDLAGIRANLEFALEDGLITQERHDTARAHTVMLAAKVKSFAQKYPEKESVVPEEIKQEILLDLKSTPI